jgi:hypothetical protein
MQDGNDALGSSLILDHVDARAAPARQLLPLAEPLHALESIIWLKRIRAIRPTRTSQSAKRGLAFYLRGKEIYARV